MHLFVLCLVLAAWQTSPVFCSSLSNQLLPTPTPSIHINIDTQPIPFHDLPALFAAREPSNNIIDLKITETIRNTLSLYPLAIDGKDFASLESVFAPNAVANYSAPLGVLSPLSAIQETLSANMRCVTTQHSLGTQVIDILDPWHARSVTYYTAVHFGKGDRSQQVATAYGQYQDRWERQDDGGWRIVGRNLVYMGDLIGDLSVFVC